MRILHVGYGFRPWRVGGLIAYAEDVMEGQAARGHEVTYFFRGRHYPGLSDDRLRSWSRRGIRMREILNSSLVTGGHKGTLTPEADLQHLPSERHFVRVLDEIRPEVVHLQELLGLPSSLIDLARERGVPVVATLQDYFPLCPVLKLYDVDGQICLRHDVGAQCARCSAGAPDNRRTFRYLTLQYELARVLGQVRAERGMERLLALKPGGRRGGGSKAGADQPAADRYQARRDENVSRLSRVDALVAQSRRVGEIYAQLGVDESRIGVLQLTLRSLERLTPRAILSPPRPVRFATLNGATSVEKGSELVIGALERLRAAGVEDGFTLTVLGGVPEETSRRLERFPAVRIGGRYEPDDLDRLLEEVDVGIVPSIWEEAYGYVGPEFLAKGIPVIGNAMGGIVDYTREGETGWVNSDSSAGGLAEIMARIIGAPEQVSELNRWVLEHREEIIKPFDAHLDELESLYGEVVATAST